MENEITSKINLNVEAAEYGYAILKNIKDGNTISEEDFHIYYNSEGIQFLKAHLLNHGGFHLTYELFKEFHINLKPSNVFGKSILQGIEVVDIYRNICKFDVGKFESKIIERVNTYLNEDISKYTINLFFIFGIRGTAITQSNNIALDLCDGSLYTNMELSLERVAELLAHEVHHFGVHKASEQLNAKDFSSDKAFKYSVIEGLLSEGMAYLYFTPWLMQEAYVKPLWKENLKNIEQSIDELFLLLESTLTKEQQEEIENKLFGEGLLGYTMGYCMVRAIQREQGDEGVKKLLGSFELFEEWYKLSGGENEQKYNSVKYVIETKICHGEAAMKED